MKKLSFPINFLGLLPEWLLSTLVLFGISFSVFARVLLRPSQMIFGGDFLQFYFWEDFLRDELLFWRLPLWNPFFFSGYPSLANPQMMTFYPIAILLRLLPLSYSSGVGLMLHIGWAGLGMYWLSRNANVRQASSFVTAIAFMLCGFLVPRLEAGHLDIIYGAAWLPWNVLLWHKLLTESKWRWSILVGIGMAMQFLAGFPSIVLMTAIVLLIMTMQSVLLTLLRGELKPTLFLIGRAALSVIFTLAFTAPQLLPTLELVRLSTRANGMPVDCSNLFTLTLFDFATLTLAKTPFDVFIPWERAMYFGALPLLFALIGLSVSGEKTRWRNLLIVIAIIGALLGFGSSLPFYSLIPLITFFRVPSQFILLICFAGCGLAGIGFERVVEWLQDSSKAIQWFIVLALGVAAVAAIADVMLYKTQQFDGGSLFGIFSILSAFSSPRYFLVALLMLVLSRMWRSRVGVIVVIVFVALDMWLFSYPYLPIISATSQSIQSQPLLGYEPRIVTSPYMYSNRSMGTHVANAQGYAPIVVASYSDFIWGNRPLSECPASEHVDIPIDDQQLLRLLSVNSINKFKSVAEELNGYYPRVAFVSEAVFVPTNAEAIKLARAADFDPTKKVIVEGNVNQPASTGTGSLRVTEYGTQDLTVLVDAMSDGWFYINDVWYPGWRAWVNGKETTVYRANGTFRAVRVPAGQSTVFMKYESTYLNLGLMIGGVTWSAMFFLLLWHWGWIQKVVGGIKWYLERVF